MKKLLCLAVVCVVMTVCGLAVMGVKASASAYVPCISSGNGCYDGLWWPTHKESSTLSAMY